MYTVHAGKLHEKGQDCFWQLLFLPHQQTYHDSNRCDGNEKGIVWIYLFPLTVFGSAYRCRATSFIYGPLRTGSIYAVLSVVLNGGGGLHLTRALSALFTFR